jgi:hypothetical protein
MITRAQINKVLEEPVVKHIPQPEGSLRDDELIRLIVVRAWAENSHAALARLLNLDPRLISKAVNGYLTPQVACALGYKAMRHFNGTDAYRIWVKINQK